MDDARTLAARFYDEVLNGRRVEPLDELVAEAMGTHRGELFGHPPTNRLVTWTAIHIWRVADGRLTERWSEVDMRAITEQLSSQSD